MVSGVRADVAVMLYGDDLSAKLRHDGLAQDEAVLEGTRLRFRPVMMTATVAALGLVPFLFAHGPGSEIQRPLAIAVIGGLLSSTALTLLLLPVLYGFFEGTGEVGNHPA